ncbi:MAG: hypothetical protein K2W97_03735 [Chthoniobacterales bacterium]|nr:hypothetical protein [Chthoniobacterales bacterium]
MRKLLSLIALTAIAATISSLGAKPLVFSNLNFSIELPDDWILLNPTQPEHALAARNNDNTKTVLVVVFKIPTNLSPNNISSGIANFKNGWKSGLVKGGWKISKEQPTVIADIPFVSFTATENNISCLNYFTSAGDYFYGIKCEEYNAQDPEVLSIINSFRLLSPAKINSLPPETTTTGYTLGLKMNDFLALFTIPALLLIGGLVYYNGSMRKRNEHGSDSMD